MRHRLSDPRPKPEPFPGPARIPEPGPARIPEPGPDPVPEPIPGPAVVPEPGPAPVPEPVPDPEPQQAELRNARVARIVAEMDDMPGYEVLEHRDANGMVVERPGTAGAP
jgi:hypothetical protein